jgi:hypothetical protein
VCVSCPWEVCACVCANVCIPLTRSFVMIGAGQSQGDYSRGSGGSVCVCVMSMGECFPPITLGSGENTLLKIKQEL